MKSRYDLIVFDIDGTLCPSGKILKQEHLKLMGTIAPEQFRLIDTNIFDYSAFPGVKETVLELSTIARQAVISNCDNKNMQRNKLILIGLENMFDPIYVSEEFAQDFFNGVYDQNNRHKLRKLIEKPSPTMFFEMNVQTKIEPSKSIYIGNTDKDHLAAKSAGWDFIRIKDNEFTVGINPDKIIEQTNFKKILKYVL